MSWDSFAESVTEAQKLAQPDDFDFLHRIGESYATLRRYAPEFLAVLKLRAAPAAKNVLDAIEVLRGMNTDNARKLPADRLHQAALAETGDDRRRHRPALLRTVRAVRVEELPALGRHLGAGFTPVQGLRGLPGTAREVHQPQAVQRIAAGRGHRLRTISA
ncbi:transposase TnpA, Tn21 [Klebsiella pneumoniae]|nr:transposase TnpA, Tn21 [Klebsiella pneumoniae]